jgi:hypothetical protein
MNKITGFKMNLCKTAVTECKWFGGFTKFQSGELGFQCRKENRVYPSGTVLKCSSYEQRNEDIEPSP